MSAIATATANQMELNFMGFNLRIDWPLLLLVLTIVTLGLVMISSASVGVSERLSGDPTHYFMRQLIYVAAGLGFGFVTWTIPTKVVSQLGPLLLLIAALALTLIFIPGIGKTVNGSTRWIAMGPINLQVSEVVKLAFIIYLAEYLVRRGEMVRESIHCFLKPMLLVAGFSILLLLEPDFGATVVLFTTVMGMFFLYGVRLWIFAGMVAIAGSGLAILAISSPYRMERLTAFLNPWADPFNSGFQLTQALIAFGRGEWFGVGLGGSVQKLFYLPEAHTDFVYSVVAEELGMLGAGVVVLLFALLVGRIFLIGQRAERNGMIFGAYLSYGVAIWIALQAFINMGVNMGLLPTKGLTLPLMSYGGSSVIVMLVALALVLRVASELPQYGVSVSKGGGAK
ncbi:MAG: putative lipid II flippase FtsW [Gammaproteobacteria bacterium]|nr:putative lipid II flippase FtsW [Gammaproteobacteria bacterium]